MSPDIKLLMAAKRKFLLSQYAEVRFFRLYQSAILFL